MYLLLPWSQLRMKVVQKSHVGWFLHSYKSQLPLLFLETTASSYSALWNWHSLLQFILEAREGRTCLILVQGLEFSKVIQLRGWSNRHQSTLRWEAQLWLALNFLLHQEGQMWMVQAWSIHFTLLVCLLERIVDKELKSATRVGNTTTQKRTMVHPAFPEKKHSTPILRVWSSVYWHPPTSWGLCLIHQHMDLHSQASHLLKQHILHTSHSSVSESNPTL